MTTLNIHLPKRHPAQQQVINQAKRYNVVACGRRWGKTSLALDLILEPPGILEGLPVSYYTPKYKDLTEFWRSAKRTLSSITREKNETEMRLEFITGGTLTMWNLDPDTSRGRANAKAILDECAISPHLEEAWNEAIRPTLTDHAGTAWFFSTPKGLDYFHELFKRSDADWASWQKPTSENPFIPPREINAARNDLPATVFRQEYEAEFLAEFGAVFNQPATYDKAPPTGKVGTGCDFAYTSKSGDYTAFVTGALSNNIIYITNVTRVRQDATVWAPQMRDYQNCFAFIGGQEKGIAEFLRTDYGVTLRTEPARVDKLARAMPAVTMWNRGEIRVPTEAPWLQDFLLEVLAFTGSTPGEVDDQVDALAGLHRVLVGRPTADYAELKKAMGLR